MEVPSANAVRAADGCCESAFLLVSLVGGGKRASQIEE